MPWLAKDLNCEGRRTDGLYGILKRVTPATVKDVWQVDLELEVAEELMDALNWIDEHRPAKSDAK
jgi:hypothetical protein